MHRQKFINDMLKYLNTGLKVNYLKIFTKHKLSVPFA